MKLNDIIEKYVAKIKRVIDSYGRVTADFDDFIIYANKFDVTVDYENCNFCGLLCTTSMPSRMGPEVKISGVMTPEAADHFRDIVFNPEKAMFWKKNVRINDTWVLTGAFIKDMVFHDYSYDQDDSHYEMTLCADSIHQEGF